MLAFKNLALRRGPRLLFSDVDLTLHAGWRVGVIGRNGCGKSSLFAAVRGEIEPDKGDIDRPNKLRMASVAQETPALPDPALDFVLSGDAAVHAAIRMEAEAMAAEDYEKVAEAHTLLAELNGYDAPSRAAKLLHGLGFPSHTHDTPVGEFSGGWRVRLNVARALMTPSDLLLLDEPTNHLDLDAVLWLEEWLRSYPGTLLVISHDREFLDGLCTHTLHLHEGKAKTYVGGYTAFERQRAEHLRLQQIAHEKEQVERAHLQAFIDRFKAKASKAKQAQSRMKRLEKLAGTEAVRAEREVRIDFPVPLKQPTTLIQIRDADCGYTANEKGEGGVTKILGNVGLSIEAGDRLGLLGPNGAGKSTLVKTLVGELPLLSGERTGHPDLVIGYFAQHTVESLHEGQTPIDHLRMIAPNTATQDFRDFLGKWNFPGDRAFEVIDGFSGGERARLALAMIAWRKPNVLLLDEPTNHLDLEMREALAEALADFDGAIVMVSHDRHLIGLVCDRYVRVADGIVEPYDEDLDAYATWLKQRGNNANAKARTVEAKPAAKAEPVAAAKPPAKPGKPVDGATKKRHAAVEAKLSSLAAEAEVLDAELAAASSKGGAQAAQALAALGQRRSALQTERETLELEWLELAERIEAG
ncbi:ABC-F family ATP-binding cassette domain-containing protein [Silanimonas sp.]|uniref:ABC-F family ATP-binding cassette domain-containing protein n=1 Tax=Silanimonas sp. TaxID=1929290 RepID=UPI0022C3504E|nr:ABC-F family ATP-binding cassette domain-containing protein [Silanimonas sp.]MCZ8062409.1 ABC-F family ATP-binding cassette domain-containing protein [Silanimonas sp.]